MASDNTVELKRDGRSHEMALSQLNTRNIALAFGLDPKSVWLKDRLTGRCYFPDGESFKAEDLEEHTYTLLVEGAPPTSSERSPLSLVAGSSSAGSSSSSGDAGSSSSTLQQTSKGLGSKVYNMCTTKVVKAEKRMVGGKVEFTALGVMYVELKPSTANVNYIQSYIQKTWGSQYVIVSNDGLQIQDTSATRGIKFWKVGSRKVFAIPSETDEPPPAKKSRRNFEGEDIREDFSDKLDSIDFKLSKILAIAPHLKLPLGLSSVLLQTFECSICKCSPLRPPPIFARCCKQIVGCTECVDTLYKGESGMLKSCPLCRSDRAYTETCKINGLEELLLIIREQLEPPGELPQRAS